MTRRESGEHVAKWAHIPLTLEFMLRAIIDRGIPYMNVSTRVGARREAHTAYVPERETEERREVRTAENIIVDGERGV